MEVERLEGRRPTFTEPDRKLDTTLQTAYDPVQVDAGRILNARDVLGLLSPDVSHVVLQQWHAKAVGGSG